MEIWNNLATFHPDNRDARYNICVSLEGGS